MDHKFFNFVNPFLEGLDNGTLFSKAFVWIFMGMAVLNLGFPFYLLYCAVDYSIFDQEPLVITAVFLATLVFTFSSWIGFQLWWNRKSDLPQIFSGKSPYFITPALAHLIRTTGEWLGSLILLNSLFGSILVILITGDAGITTSNLIMQMVHFIPGIKIVAKIQDCLFPVGIGFLTFVVSRHLSELLNAFMALVRNTEK